MLKNERRRLRSTSDDLDLQFARRCAFLAWHELACLGWLSPFGVKVEHRVNITIFFFFWQNYRFKVRMCRGKRPAGAGCHRLCLASDIFHQSLWENFIGKSFNLLSDKLWWNAGVYYCMRMVKSAEGSISMFSATLSGITVWFSSQESKSN